MNFAIWGFLLQGDKLITLIVVFETLKEEWNQGFMFLLGHKTSLISVYSNLIIKDQINIPNNIFGSFRNINCVGFFLLKVV